ncbi:DUF1659 domain-containing protein [Neobacillus vireti]|uniref:DUF1659 domain-containing protein n=1 Tax=Neobacillus vireti LMG 21834 TaxID=1131730 RepID=A0AB94IFU1_9BACI|nr:DUF1659 domain-containing protein [Neobacillus vireti]ETI65979.1 hypothetical protein BAVI_24903 [Neobacillus vireti LMG 21834]KLT17509.1 hypothetical protein AA980_12885 [Neobacillus vireti]
MATALLLGTKLRLVFEAGMDDEGNPLYKAKTFSNVKKEATVDQLYQAAHAISVLCKDTLNKVERNDSTEILA